MRKFLPLFLFLGVTQIQAQVVNAFAGNGNQGFSGDGGQATLAELNAPKYAAFDISGNIYFTDQVNNRIRKITPSGIISTIAGISPGFNGDGGPATSALINNPSGITIDKIGNIYFFDTYNYRIRKINTSGIINTIAGTVTSGYSGDGGPATLANILGEDIAVDTIGNVYFADGFNNVIRKIDITGVITTIAGNGTQGFGGDGGQASAAVLNYPKGIFIDKSNTIYISDLGNYRIRKIDAFGIINTIAGTGTQGYTGDGGLAISATLQAPLKLIMSSKKELYFSDSYVIRKIDSMGVISTYAGNGLQGFTGDGGPALAAKFNVPYGIAFDASDNLHVCDLQNNVVRKITRCTSTPIVISLSGDTNVCDFTYDTLRASGATSYIWSTGATTNTITVYGYNTNVNTYWVAGATGNCSDRQSITITSVLPPTINVTGNLSVCTNANTLLTATGATSYTWSSNANNSFYDTVTVSASSNTTYTVWGKDSGLCTGTKTVNLQVSQIPILTPIANINLCGDTSGSTPQIFSNHGASVNWTNTNIGTGPATGTLYATQPPSTSEFITFTTSAVTTTQTGVVTLIPNVFGCIGPPLTFTITVSPSFSMDVLGDFNFLCPGQNDILTGTGATTYTWSTNAGYFYTDSITLTPLFSQNGMLTGTTGACTKHKLYSINVNDTILITGARDLCLGDSLFLSSGIIYPSTYHYNWNPGSDSTKFIKISPAANTIYTLTITDGMCVHSDTFSVNITNCSSQNNCNNLGFDMGNYSDWIGGIGTNSVSSNAPLIITNYNISTLGMNSLLSSASRFTLEDVTAPNDLYGNFSSFDPIDGSYAVRLGGDSINLNYNGEIIEQIFTVTKNTKAINYRYALVLEDGGHNNGEQPYFRAEVLDSADAVLPCLSYSVEAINGSAPTGFNLSTITSINTNWLENVYYKSWSVGNFDLAPYIGKTVKLRFTVAGCIYSGHFGYAYIDCSCDSSLFQSTNSVICSGQTSTLNAVNGYSSYNWTGPGIVGASNTQSVTVNTGGTYSVALTNQNGCVSTETVSVISSSNPAPVITINGSDTICNGQNTTLIASGATTYTWSANAGSVTSNTVSLSPTNNTTYTVTGTNSAGCINTNTQTVYVLSCVGIDNISGNKNQLSVYPNPLGNNIVIQSSTELGLISVYNTLGEIIYSEKTTTSQQQIDLSKQPKGIYLLLVQGKYIRLIKE